MFALDRILIKDSIIRGSAFLECSLMLVEVRTVVSIATYNQFVSCTGGSSFVLRPNDDEHQRVCNDASDEDGLHFRIVLHEHGFPILDDRRFQVVTAS